MLRGQHPDHLGLSDTRLATLAGLAALESVGSLGLANNDELVDLTGLAALAQVGSVEIEGNAALTSLAGLEAATVLSRLDLTDNPLLADLDALAGLTAAGQLNVFRNPGLTSLAPLAGASVSIVGIHDNVALTELAPLAGEVVELTVEHNPLLGSLAGLEGITVTHDLRIVDNDALVDLQGLGAVTVEVGKVVIADNAGLLGLDGPTGPASAFEIEITGNPKLASLAMLSGLTSVNTLWISGTALKDAVQLDALTSADSTFVLEQNPALTSLAGLANLASVAHLRIRDNPKLTSIAALADGALVDVSMYFELAANTSLPSCAAMAVYDGLMPPPVHYCYTNKADACSGADSCMPFPFP